MKTTKRKRGRAEYLVTAEATPGGTSHPEFRAFTQGRMPFPDVIDFYAMRDADAWIYERELELREEIDALSSALSEALDELRLLKLPQDCHAEEKAVALLLSIGNGRLVQNLYEAIQTCMFDMAQRFSSDEKWVVTAKLTATVDENNHNKADISGEVKATIPPVGCSGAIYMDTAGNLLTPKEAVKQLSMFQYGVKAA